MKSKKWIWVIIGVIVIVGCLIGIREIYNYNNPNVTITYKVLDSEDKYMSLPSYGIESKSQFGNGYASKYDEQMKQWWIPTNEMEVRLQTEYVKPMNITSNVTIKDGKTIITYSGIAGLPNGEIVPIDEEIVLDFVVTKNLP